MTPLQPNGASGPKPRGRRKKIRTEPIRPICPQCEKQFSNQSALTKHKLTHSDERKFACPQCSKAFKRHDHLTGHMQTHSNRKPFNCTIPGCDKTYCDARSLRRHKENIHHIVTPRDMNNNNGSHMNHNNYHHNHHHHHLHHLDQNNNNINAHATSLAACNTNINNLQALNNNNNNNCQQQQPLLIGDPQNHHQDLSVQQQPISNNQQTPQTNTSNQQSQPQQQHQQQQQTHNQHQQQVQHQEPSHLLRRRIERLHQSADQSGNYDCNVDQQLACFTVTPSESLIPPPPLTQPYGNSNHMDQDHHYHHHHHQHASYSADYALTQHFNFEFPHVNTTSHLHGPNHHLHDHHLHNHHHLQGSTPHLSHIHTTLEDSLSTGSVPHSADSVTDSGLGLNVQYERPTPQPLQAPRYNHQLSQQQQQTASQQQQVQNREPSHLLRRRTQRLNQSDQSGGENCNVDQLVCFTVPPSESLIPPPPLTQPYGNSNHMDQDPYLSNNHHQHASFSADYASTQHFNFEFAPVNTTNHLHGPSDLNDHQHQDHNHQAGSTPHLSHLNTPLEHTLSTGSVPHSADSVTDSGLSLNVHYEQHTLQPLQAPRYNHQLSQQQQLQQQQTAI